jgi:hypothetical protein
MPTLRYRSESNGARVPCTFARAIPPGFVSFTRGAASRRCRDPKTPAARAATFSDRRGQRPSVYASSEARLARRRFGVSLAAAGKTVDARRLLCRIPPGAPSPPPFSFLWAAAGNK